jgi:hypothetical protein
MIHTFVVTPAQQFALQAGGINIDSAVTQFVLDQVNSAQQSQLGSAFQLVIQNDLPLDILTSLKPTPVVPIAITIVGPHSFSLTVDQENVLTASRIKIDLEVSNYVAQQLAYLQLLSFRTAYAAALLKVLPASSFNTVNPSFVVPI